MIVSIYLSEPFPSFPPKYLLSLSPTESLLCSSDGKLWFPHTNSIGSDLTSSFKRFGGDGVKLSLSVDDDDNPLPFALLVKLFGAKIRRKNEKKNRLKFPYIKHFVEKNRFASSVPFWNGKATHSRTSNLRRVRHLSSAAYCCCCVWWWRNRQRLLVAYDW